VLELLSSGLPVKVLVETSELLTPEHFGVGLRGTQLASAVVGLIDVFTFQATSSSLYQLRERLFAGLRYPGAALLSVFSGTAASPNELPPYLLSAAALEGRAFPAFTYDPGAGPDLASRFSVDENPQPELDWPLARLEYADASLQRVAEQVAFTLVDFAACDRRYARHFARIPREQWSDETVPVDEWLTLDPAEAETRVPHVLVVDEDNRLQRLVVDARLMRATRRCRELWRGLQELGLTRLRLEPLPVTDTPTEAESSEEPVDEAPEAAAGVAEAPSADDPWIETSRCSTCNECTAINDRMFAYNDNKQAYIKDPDAGTFRDLVEAAESCQVAVIHPGKPRRADEPGLEELVERAKIFQ
jgi:ferredoxin